MTPFLECRQLSPVPSGNRRPHRDFCCFEHRPAIELDSGVHSQIDQMRRGAVKEDYLRALGIRLLRIPNAMVLEHPDEFVREVG
jgi:very-short-patch-repair endonuclease